MNGRRMNFLLFSSLLCFFNLSFSQDIHHEGMNNGTFIGNKKDDGTRIAIFFIIYSITVFTIMVIVVSVSVKDDRIRIASRQPETAFI
ncbi:unnamed protein product [Larinioides sclopetarius]|uniref:Uncharacterized protein n=1 Tax=Larinioides sclopetarius TaxID=280406 RepID=A0AAV2BM29_9ARAC